VPSGVASVLAAANLRSAEDYERTFARKLTENEYFFNGQLGFLSLNIPLQADEVLAVAFQYTYNGKLYQVGEFSEGVALNPYQWSTTNFIFKIIESNHTKNRFTYLGFDDEKRIFIGFIWCDSATRFSIECIV